MGYRLPLVLDSRRIARSLGPEKPAVPQRSQWLQRNACSETLPDGTRHGPPNSDSLSESLSSCWRRYWPSTAALLGLVVELRLQLTSAKPGEAVSIVIRRQLSASERTEDQSEQSASRSKYNIASACSGGVPGSVSLSAVFTEPALAIAWSLVGDSSSLRSSVVEGPLESERASACRCKTSQDG